MERKTSIDGSIFWSHTEKNRRLSAIENVAASEIDFGSHESNVPSMERTSSLVGFRPFFPELVPSFTEFFGRLAA